METTRTAADLENGTGTVQGSVAPGAPVSAAGRATTAPGRDAEALTAYLADRDVPCPHCGYNLHGCPSTMCPECGRGLALTVASTRRLFGLGLFLLLAFAWVFLASGMNAARQVKRMHESALTAASPMRGWQMMTTTGSITVNGRTTTWSSTTPGSAGRLTVGPDGTVRMAMPPVRIAPGVTNGLTTTTPRASGSSGGAGGAGGSPAAPVAWAPLPVSAAPVAPAWGALPASEWWMLGWWGGLAGASISGLVVLLILRLRGRAPGRVAARWMVVWACAVFALYSGYHVQAFVRDAMTW